MARVTVIPKVKKTKSQESSSVVKSAQQKAAEKQLNADKPYLPSGGLTRGLARTRAANKKAAQNDGYDDIRARRAAYDKANAKTLKNMNNQR